MKRREIELKFRLGEQLAPAEVVERLVGLGFEVGPTQLEFDFVPDTAGFLCREHKIMLRLRRVTRDGGSRRVLLTFKAKRNHRQFLDADETEFYLDQPDDVAWQHMNERLAEVGVRLPDTLLEATDYVQAVKLVAAGGLNYFRMMIEKKRTTYAKGEVVATIDELPKGIGEFLELEAHDEAALRAVVEDLGLATPGLEKVDYGDIVMAHNGSRDANGRTAVFDEATRREVVALMKGGL